MPGRHIILPSLAVLPVRSDPFDSRGASQLCYIIDACDDKFQDSNFYGHRNAQTLYACKIIHAPNKLPFLIWVSQSRIRMHKKYSYDRAQGYIDRKNIHLVLDLLMDEDDVEDDRTSPVQPVALASKPAPVVAQPITNSTYSLHAGAFASIHGQVHANLTYTPSAAPGSTTINNRTQKLYGTAPVFAQLGVNSGKSPLPGAFVLAQGQGQGQANLAHTPSALTEFSTTSNQAPGSTGATPTAAVMAPPALFPSAPQPRHGSVKATLPTTPTAASPASPLSYYATSAGVVTTTVSATKTTTTTEALPSASASEKFSYHTHHYSSSGDQSELDSTKNLAQEQWMAQFYAVREIKRAKQEIEVQRGAEELNVMAKESELAAREAASDLALAREQIEGQDNGDTDTKCSTSSASSTNSKQDFQSMSSRTMACPRRRGTA
ncbi:hypothetical protein BGZ47_009994 [Haplosporangium gracile]|nr:hypothetical protein BGZ47_009994 [Haplosporangium gracile]